MGITFGINTVLLRTNIVTTIVPYKKLIASQAVGSTLAGLGKKGVAVAFNNLCNKGFKFAAAEASISDGSIASIAASAAQKSDSRSIGLLPKTTNSICDFVEGLSGDKYGGVLLTLECQLLFVMLGISIQHQVSKNHHLLRL